MSDQLAQDTRRSFLQVVTQSRAARMRAVRASFAERHWDVDYRYRIVVTDVVVVCAVIAGVYFQRWDIFQDHPVRNTPSWVYGPVAILIAVAWVLSLMVARSHDTRVMGSGLMEYRRVFSASWRLFAVLAILSFFSRFWEARGYLALAFPVGVLCLLTGRYLWRQWLRRQRERGLGKSAVLAIGHRDQAERLIENLNNKSSSAYRVVGVCIPTGQITAGEHIQGVPVLGDLRQASNVVAHVGADIVAVSGSDAITADVVRRLGWELEPQGVDLMLTAELADVAGPRITVTPAETVSLLHVDAPRFTGPKFAIKATTDWIGAAFLTALLLPFFIVIGLGVKLTSRGPVFFRQTRVGRNGKTFSMYKFRSMRVGADQEVDKLAALNEGAGPLFLIRDDPRVTTFGKFIRRHSIDELPQLFNVLRGDMSLVGPRPPLPTEVSAYEKKVRRRLLVKPGLTGLWQVGGRSDLSWEESVRLDVYYVENWTVFGDLLILLKTARTVISGHGAY